MSLENMEKPKSRLLKGIEEGRARKRYADLVVRLEELNEEEMNLATEEIDPTKTLRLPDVKDEIQKVQEELDKIRKEWGISSKSENEEMRKAA